MVESSQSEAQVPHQGTTHETTDASIGGVLAAGGALFVLLALVLLVLKGLFDFYFAREAEKKQALSPSVMREPRRPPLEPRLEGLEDLETTDPQLLAFRAASQLGFSTAIVPGKTPADTAAAAATAALFLQPPTMRKSPAQELKTLKDYGWVDREA